MNFGGDRLFYVNLVDEMSKCYYCSLWVMNYGAGGLVAREKRKHLMVPAGGSVTNMIMGDEK